MKSSNIPQSGWEEVDVVDLGEPKGTCTYCGNIIRYIHIIENKEWGVMGVGCCCACRLTQSTEPEKKEKALKMYQEKLERYLGSRRWKHYKNGSFYTLEGYKIKIWDHQSYANLQIDYPSGWSLGKYKQYDSLKSKVRYPTVEEAKTKAFEVIIKGYLQKYLKTKNKK